MYTNNSEQVGSLNVKALDDGYGDIKYDSKGVPNLVPSFVTGFKEKPVENFQQGSQNHLRYIASEVDNRRYLVGDYAARLDPNIRWVGGENKHTDNKFPILLKTTLGLMTSGSHEVVDTLMMNLPIKYDTPERRRILTDIALGTHQVGISTDGKNFVNKAITVEDVLIKKQPFGSVCDIILDGDGNIADKEVAKGFNVIVDTGARTLNILTVDALEEQPELSTQTNDGMFTAYGKVSNYLEEELGVIIPDGKLPQIIKSREVKGRDITPLIDAAYEDQANNIINILDKVLINSWAFVTSIIFTGGGADKQLLRPYFEKAIGDRVHCVYLDRFANARGLRKYGIRHAKKNIKRNGIQIRVGHHD